MKQYFIQSLIYFFITSVLSANAYSVEKMIFSSGAGHDSDQPKFIAPILTEAFARHGYSLQVKFFPSKRALLMANSGKVDGELNRVKNLHLVTHGQYTNLIRIDEPILTVNTAVFSKRSSTIETFTELANLKIAYKAGRQNTKKQLSSILPKDLIVAVSSDSQAFRLLKAGRVDAVMTELGLGQRIISGKAGFEGIKVLWKSEEIDIYSYIHSKHEKLGLKIAQTLKEMKQDGSFETITAAIQKQLAN